MILIASALKSYLSDHTDGQTDDPVRNAARKRLFELVGNSIGINREPTAPHKFQFGKHPGQTDSWMIIRRTGTTRHQGLSQESNLAAQTLDITAYASGGPSALVAELAGEAARLALSTWQGYWSYRDEDQVKQRVWIADAIADGDDMNAFRFQEGKRWTDWASFTCRVTYQQRNPRPLPVLMA
jgi:hypothetical protein